MLKWRAHNFDLAKVSEIEAEEANRWNNQADPSYYDRWRSQNMCQFTDALYLEYLKGESFLEVGCGRGHLMAKLREKYPTARFVGIDISSFMVNQCMERGFTEVFIGSGNKLEFPDASFDAVFAGVWVMRYLHPQLALKEMYRVLRPGGRVAFDLPFVLGHGFFTIGRLLLEPLHRWKSLIANARLYLDGRSVSTWKRYLCQAGFRVLDVVGGIDSPIKSQKYGFRRIHRSLLGLMLSSVVWFLAEKPNIDKHK